MMVPAADGRSGGRPVKGRPRGRWPRPASTGVRRHGLEVTQLALHVAAQLGAVVALELTQLGDAGLEAGRARDRACATSSRPRVSASETMEAACALASAMSLSRWARPSATCSSCRRWASSMMPAVATGRGALRGLGDAGAGAATGAGAAGAGARSGRRPTRTPPAWPSARRSRRSSCATPRRSRRGSRRPHPGRNPP